MKIDIASLSQSSSQLQGACSGVYFLFNDGQLVYIGEGWNCLLRVAEHTRKDSSKVFNQWNFVAVEGATERKNLERELRKIHKPLYNRV